MTVREVLLLAAAFLDDSGLASAVSGSTADGEAGVLVNCFNVVENEIALDDYPLKKTETLQFSKGILPYTSFSAPPVDVCAVESGGIRQRFKLTPEGVKCDCRTADVTFTYAPKKKDIADTSELDGKISPRLVALGVASEYCFIKGRTDEAKIWGVKYREALRAAGILRHPLSVRSRRWA